ncbi:PREDICTED: lysosomal acid lipase/cholesteryl ester hydrolase-like [Priapulus caudatus]|uniref:Lipase n=1 Tax=Priapulus caudatus TaxID=37621 RepID=A0ABM1E1X6_PRICU|nr:PREDICTED: lysosomal acid lipase/cholesteryl ester hydrolase-like [Priapulus caudatus]
MNNQSFIIIVCCVFYELSACYGSVTTMKHSYANEVSQRPQKHLFSKLRFHRKWLHNIDPEVYMNASELITSKGYPCEEYSATTSDGYILGLQRIPHGKKNANATAPRPVVFLQHGLLCDSTNWITNLENESFAFLLADAGFDVWLGNIRGNDYSLRHESLTKNQSKFWDFTSLQVAILDVLQIHLATKVKLFTALGPVFTVGYTKGLMRWLVPFATELDILLKLAGDDSFLHAAEPLLKFLGRTLCRSQPLNYICSDIIFLIGGFDEKQLNMTRLPVYISKTPSATSTKNIMHFVQMVKSKKCRMYDYGYIGNLRKYGQFHPPEYSVSQMETPVALFSGGCDWLADPRDVSWLKTKIKNIIYEKVIEPWAHLDFIWGIDAVELVYKPVIDMMRKFEQNATTLVNA